MHCPRAVVVVLLFAEVSEKERVRALKAKDDKDAEDHAYLTAHTTHGSHLVVEAHSGLDPNADAADAPEYKTLDNVRESWQRIGRLPERTAGRGP